MAQTSSAVPRSKQRGKQVRAYANHKAPHLTFSGFPIFYLISPLGVKSVWGDWCQLHLLLQSSMSAGLELDLMLPLLPVSLIPQPLISLLSPFHMSLSEPTPKCQF